MTAAPKGELIAWVANDRGSRNIWVAAPPEYVPKAVTSYSGDDGQEIGELAWLPDASAIVYTRGGAPNSSGELPNPESLPFGVARALWVVSAEGGQPRRIGEGHGAAVSPKDGTIAFIHGREVWMAGPGGTGEVRIKMRGQPGSLRWSPDGSRLAMVSSRGGHSFIGVYSLEGQTLRWMDPGVDKDSEPAWSPDGSRIAFLRVASREEVMWFTPVRSGPPWSIRVADVATGAGKAVWTAEAGRGSVFREVTAGNQILWSSSGHLVFPWERDGWTHLYSVEQGGGAAKLLTFGDFEVEQMALTPDGRDVLYSANADDPDRRHLFRVPAGGGPANALTSGKGIEWSPAMTSDGKALAFLRSDAKAPARVAVQAAFGAARDLTPAVPVAQIEPQAVEFSAADGRKVRGQLFTSGANGKKPALVFFHGGPRRQMLLGWHYSSYYNATYAFNQYMASQGYVVLSVNYRGGIGYGMEYREALESGAAGASEFQDVIGAGLYLQSRPDVDSRRIAAWGGSYGGFLTAMALAKASNLFVAGVDIHGVHDWNTVIPNFYPWYRALERPEQARIAFESSPLAHVKGWRSPVLLIHGDDDRNVPFRETVRLAGALRDRGVEFEQLILPDEVHGFLRHASWRSAFEAAAAFLDRKLKGSN